MDVEVRGLIRSVQGREHRGCECPSVLRCLLAPEACPLFATACTPETPLGACVVSSECAAVYHYGQSEVISA